MSQVRNAAQRWHDAFPPSNRKGVTYLLLGSKSLFILLCVLCQQTILVMETGMGTGQPGSHAATPSTYCRLRVLCSATRSRAHGTGPRSPEYWPSRSSRFSDPYCKVVVGREYWGEGVSFPFLVIFGGLQRRLRKYYIGEGFKINAVYWEN